MKRLNRKKLIEEFESLRQGFRSVLDFAPLDDVQRASFEVYHRDADRMVKELGGDSVREPKPEPEVDPDKYTVAEIPFDAILDALKHARIAHGGPIQMSPKKMKLPGSKKAVSGEEAKSALHDYFQLREKASPRFEGCFPDGAKWFAKTDVFYTERTDEFHVYFHVSVKKDSWTTGCVCTLKGMGKDNQISNHIGGVYTLRLELTGRDRRPWIVEGPNGPSCYKYDKKKQLIPVGRKGS